MRKVLKNFCHCFSVAFTAGGMFTVLYADSSMYVQAAALTFFQWIIAGILMAIWVDMDEGF